MIEIKASTHIQRLFANRLQKSDLFRAVYYAGYRGEEKDIPFYYTIEHGNSAVTDLRQTEDEIFSSMKSNTRNEVRRAEREGCTFESGYDYDSFIPYYNTFCESKGLKDRVDMSRLIKYTGDNKVYITKAIHNDVVLSMHATVVNKKEKVAFLLFSCSQRLDSGVDKKLIGWGNRYLHYMDLKTFKEMGIEEYEWSGVVLDPNDERYSIGQFKLSFGGTVVNSLVLRTPLFNLMSYFRPLVERFRH